MERLLTAYQEDLLSLDELRHRVPELRAREQSMRAERQAILDQAADQISFLRLAETLTAFLQRLRQSAETLEIAERQKVVRLLVRESWSTMTPSRSGTRSRPKHQHRPPAARRYPQTANSGSAMKVTFCVRGVRGEPCGMPRRLSRASVVRVFRPRSSVSSTGHSSHILIRCTLPLKRPSRRSFRTAQSDGNPPFVPAP